MTRWIERTWIGALALQSQQKSSLHLKFSLRISTPVSLSEPESSYMGARSLFMNFTRAGSSVSAFFPEASPCSSLLVALRIYHRLFFYALFWLSFLIETSSYFSRGTFLPTSRWLSFGNCLPVDDCPLANWHLGVLLSFFGINSVLIPMLLLQTIRQMDLFLHSRTWA